MNVQNYLQEQAISFDVIEHRSTFDAQRLARALHVSGGQVAKTVLLLADNDYAQVVAIVPADRLVDLRKVSQMLGGATIELASEAQLAAHCPDCQRGALPPFGSQYGLKTLLDKSLTNQPWMVFEGNRHNEAICIQVADFRRLEQPLVADIHIAAADRLPVNNPPAGKPLPR